MLKYKLLFIAIVAQHLLLNILPARTEQLLFDFTSVLHDGIGSGSLSDDERLITGTFYADLTYPSHIYGFHDAKLGGKPIDVLTSHGVHDYWSNPSRPIASMYMKFTPQTLNGINTQVVLAFQRYNFDGSSIIMAYDADLGGGASPATFSPRYLPEIDGSILPRASFIIFGVFLMLFKNIEHSNAPLHICRGNRKNIITTQ